MSFDDAKLLEACRGAWEPVLGLTLAPGTSPQEAGAEPRFRSYVRLRGEWNGAVLVDFPRSVVRHAEAMLFSSDSDDATEDDLQAALNEMTRLFGQAFQQLVPQPVKISSGKPATNGAEASPLAEMRTVREVEVACEGRPIRVSVLEGVDSSDPD